MDQSTKQRLVGITVVFVVAVIFLPMLLDGAGVRKNDLEVTIPPQPVLAVTPEFDQKIIELHASVDAIPDLQSGFLDENSSPTPESIEAEEVKAEDSVAKVIKKPPLEAQTDKAGGETWVLQVGSFKDRDKAISERDLLRKSKIAAVFIEPFKIQGTITYRVRLGPFLNREQSTVAQNKIRAKHNIDGMIMRYEK